MPKSGKEKRIKVEEEEEEKELRKTRSVREVHGRDGGARLERAFC